MDLTPEELREVTFRERFRGYDPDEVDDFLDRAAAGVAGLHARIAQLEERATAAEQRASEGSETEGALRHTLVLAQRTADTAVAEAQQTATRVVGEAEERGRAILAQAQAAAERLGVESQQSLREELAQLQSARAALEGDVDALARYLAEERTRIRSSLTELMWRLEERVEQGMGPRPPRTAVDLPALPGAEAEAGDDDIEAVRALVPAPRGGLGAPPRVAGPPPAVWSPGAAGSREVAPPAEVTRSPEAAGPPQEGPASPVERLASPVERLASPVERLASPQEIPPEERLAAAHMPSPSDTSAEAPRLQWAPHRAPGDDTESPAGGRARPLLPRLVYTTGSPRLLRTEVDAAATDRPSSHSASHPAAPRPPEAATPRPTGVWEKRQHVRRVDHEDSGRVGAAAPPAESGPVAAQAAESGGAAAPGGDGPDGETRRWPGGRRLRPQGADDAFFAALRSALDDDQPLGPRDDAFSVPNEAEPTDDDTEDAKAVSRFRRRR